MEQELISKRELLEKYAISYGALYRWKRMGLIPEEWFIKKATVTGQETFFPARAVCERIELIKSREDDRSLNDLAKQLNAATQRQAALVIKSVFGDKTFYLSDLKGITLENGKGETRDLTEEIFEFLKQGDESWI